MPADSGEEENVLVTPTQRMPADSGEEENVPITEEDPSEASRSSDDSGASAEHSPPSPPPDMKRKEATPLQPESNKRRFQRLWSEDDEIAILRGILNHRAKTGALPCKTGMAAFHDSIGKNLSIETSPTQLREKVRRLKSKYEKNPASSSQPSAVHELSHQIWGAKEVEETGDAAKVNPPYTFLKHTLIKMGSLPCSVALEEALEYVDRAKAKAVEETLQKLWERDGGLGWFGGG